MENNKLRVLNISSYGIDVPRNNEDIFSGAIQRQIDYAGFLQDYIIISPTKEKGLEPAKPRENLEIRPVYAANRISSLIKIYLEAGRLIKAKKINCLVADNPFLSAWIGVLLKRKFHLPLIVHSMAEMLDNPYYLQERPVNYFKNFISKRIFTSFDLFRVSTRAEISHMAAKGYDRSRLHFAPFYIDAANYNVDIDINNFREEILGGKFDKMVLCLGRIARQKDLTTLIRAIPAVVKEYPRTLFLIIGDGPEKKRTKQYVGGLREHANIRFLGRVPYKDVSKYFLAGDMFVISSIYEGTCMTIHEAALFKKAIVATRFAGALDFIEDGVNGFLAEIKNPDEIAKQINYLLSRPDRIEQVGESAHQTLLKAHNKKQALDKYRAMFDKIKEKASQTASGQTLSALQKE